MQIAQGLQTISFLIFRYFSVGVAEISRNFDSKQNCTKMGRWQRLMLVIAISWSLNNVDSVWGASRLVCYFNSGASHRQGAGQFTVDNIDPFLCTHLIYVSAKFEGIIDGGSTDLDPTVVKFVQLKYKNPKLKTMLSVGSWINYQSDQYIKRVIDSKGNMVNFAHLAAQFLSRYGFDGLDFSWPWEFHSPTANDPRHFIRLLEALKNAFQSKGFLLSVAVTANQSISDSSYDIPKMEGLVDFVNLKSYNMTGSWNSMADHHAPLYARKWDTPGSNNVDSAVSYWINKGISKSKINMGIPFFGNSWTLASGAYNPPAVASGPGLAGPFTATQGELAFYEICRHVRVYKDFKAVRSSARLYGPIAYSIRTSGRTWVGYDDADMIIHKGKYILSKNLGGAVVWDISMDDFQNSCNGGINPLLTSLSRTLNVLGQNPQPFVSGSCTLFSSRFINFMVHLTLTILSLFYSRLVCL